MLWTAAVAFATVAIATGAHGSAWCAPTHTQCDRWAREGECEANTNWMFEHCAKACQHSRCTEWASEGECEKNPIWMGRNCAVSCGTCRTARKCVGYTTNGSPTKPCQFPFVYKGKTYTSCTTDENNGADFAWCATGGPIAANFKGWGICKCTADAGSLRYTMDMTKKVAWNANLAYAHTALQIDAMSEVSRGHIAWCSGSDRRKEGSWTWGSSTTPFWTKTSAKQSTRWDVGEPNNSNNADCLAVTAAGFWRDRVCSQRYWPITKAVIGTSGKSTDCAGSWEDWGRCSVSCGGGTQTRAYNVDVEASGGGAACPYRDGATKSRPCNTKSCPATPPPPQDCVGSWTAYAPCSTTCGPGVRLRTYRIVVPAEYGGAWCPHRDGEQDHVPCQTRLCPTTTTTTTPPPVDCEGTWTPFTPCSKTCGSGGMTSRVYQITRPAAHGGKNCPVKNGFVQEERCYLGACPVDCVGSWTSWGSCSSKCGAGVQRRTYKITTQAENGGKSCPAQHNQGQTRACNSGIACPVDCQGSWSSWGKCTGKCGTGAQQRTYRITVQAQHGGKTCDYFQGQVDTKPCYTGSPCAVDCVGRWSEWSLCSGTCGKGTERRTYSIQQPAQNGGSSCPAEQNEVQTRPCNHIKPCPVNCKGQWGDWGSCSSTCGVGVQQRTYTVTTPPQNGGTVCPHAPYEVQTQPCRNNVPCSVDCVGSWSGWGKCSATCGGGLQSRTFTVAVQAENGGKPCVANDQQTGQRPCNQNTPCPENCVGGWTAWSECSKTCGDKAVRSRTYQVTKPATAGGFPCPAAHNTVDVAPCLGLEPCPLCRDDEEFVQCGGCDASCDNLFPSCTRQCGLETAPGCFCPSGHVRDALGQCIPYDLCGKQTQTYKRVFDSKRTFSTMSSEEDVLFTTTAKTRSEARSQCKRLCTGARNSCSGIVVHQDDKTGQYVCVGLENLGSASGSPTTLSDVRSFEKQTNVKSPRVAGTLQVLAASSAPASSTAGSSSSSTLTIALAVAAVVLAAGLIAGVVVLSRGERPRRKTPQWDVATPFDQQ